MLAEFLANLGENAIIVFAVGIGGVAGMTVEHWYAKMQREAWKAKRGYSRKWSPNTNWRSPDKEAFDPAAQLRLVTGAKFKARRLLNASEARLFSAVERAVVEETSDWRVMAQVSLGDQFQTGGPVAGQCQGRSVACHRRCGASSRHCRRPRRNQERSAAKGWRGIYRSRAG